MGHTLTATPHGGHPPPQETPQCPYPTGDTPAVVPRGTPQQEATRDSTPWRGGGEHTKDTPPPTPQAAPQQGHNDGDTPQWGHPHPVGGIPPGPPPWGHLKEGGGPHIPLTLSHGGHPSRATKTGNTPRGTPMGEPHSRGDTTDPKGPPRDPQNHTKPPPPSPPSFITAAGGDIHRGSQPQEGGEGVGAAVARRWHGGGGSGSNKSIFPGGGRGGPGAEAQAGPPPHARRLLGGQKARDT